MDAQKSELARFSGEPVKVSGPNVIRGHIAKASQSDLEFNSDDAMCFYDEQSAIEYAKAFVRANAEAEE